VGNDVYQNIVLNAEFTKARGARSIEFGREVGDYYYANPFSVGHRNGDFGTGATPIQPHEPGRDFRQQRPRDWRSPAGISGKRRRGLQ